MPDLPTPTRAGLALALAFAACLPIGAAAQEAPTQYPPDGAAILDCAPAAPAPQDTCLLRLPLGWDYSDPDTEPLGETRGEFRITSEGRTGFPDDLTMSATVLLIDLTPGLGGGRARTFDREKALIRDLISELPPRAEVAIYGFGQDTREIVGFTDQRGRLLDAVDGLELDGVNTAIATAVSRAVDVLAARDDALLRHVVLVTDGEEEGGRPVSEVVAAARESGVVVSAMGTFWRGVGDAQTGAGMDFLQRFAEPTNGTAVRVLLPRREEAEETVGTFAEGFARALERSALIVPEGTPQPSRISLRLERPVAGRPGDTERVDAAVTYRPEAAGEAGGEGTTDPAEPEPDLLFGLPATWVYIGGAALAGLLLLAIVLLALRRGSDAAADEEDPGLAPDDDPVVPSTTEAPPRPAPVRPSPARAYLVVGPEERRVAIRESRVNVGRSTSNEIVLEHPSVSRVHAQIHVNRDGGFSVTDLDSLNKTKIDGVAITGTRPVRLGEPLAFGDVTAKLVTA